MLYEHIVNCQFEAILAAAKKIFEGIDYRELESLVNIEQLIAISNELLAITYSKHQREIIELVDSRFPVKYC